MLFNIFAKIIFFENRKMSAFCAKIYLTNTPFHILLFYIYFFNRDKQTFELIVIFEVSLSKLYEQTLNHILLDQYNFDIYNARF